jgi:hypothetical protein
MNNYNFRLIIIWVMLGIFVMAFCISIINIDNRISALEAKGSVRSVNYTKNIAVVDIPSQELSVRCETWDDYSQERVSYNGTLSVYNISRGEREIEESEMTTFYFNSHDAYLDLYTPPYYRSYDMSLADWQCSIDPVMYHVTMNNVSFTDKMYLKVSDCKGISGAA